MTEIRPRVLQVELLDCFKELERQIEEVKKAAVELGIEPHKLRSTDGSWALSPLLVAKGQVLHGLVLLGKREKQSA